MGIIPNAYGYVNNLNIKTQKLIADGRIIDKKSGSGILKL